MTEPTDDELAKLFTEETGFDVDDFPAAILDFARAVLTKWGTPAPVGVEPQCWCLTCRPMRFEDPYSVRMALCPACGNKRCPKANDHRNTCTGSNEPGQLGSAYIGGIKGGQHGTDN